MLVSGVRERGAVDLCVEGERKRVKDEGLYTLLNRTARVAGATEHFDRSIDRVRRNLNTCSVRVISQAKGLHLRKASGWRALGVAKMDFFQCFQRNRSIAYHCSVGALARYQTKPLLLSENSRKQVPATISLCRLLLL